MYETVSGSFEKDVKLITDLMRAHKSYDIIVKKSMVGDRNAAFFAIDGMIKEDSIQKLMESFSKLKPEDVGELRDTQELIDKYVSYIECSKDTYIENLITCVLSGAVLLITDGFNEGIIIDARTYPARQVQEPENDKVLRGSHEGFVETLTYNTALIRRKIRDPHLTLKRITVGVRSKTDVVVCYMEGTADNRKVDTIIKKLKDIKVDSLTMSQESLKECLIPNQLWNPFPRVRYTERPDAASACLYDGNILVITDGSPSVMIFPTGIFDFVQDVNDYYFSPCIGTFLRYVRMIVFVLSLLLTPVWYLLIRNPQWLPESFGFIIPSEEVSLPIIVQLVIVEFVIDALKLASLNTPSALSNSFSVLGALVLGEFAVSSGLFSNELVLFMAFVAIANFTQPSYELGYALKLSRLMLIVLTGLFDVWGFAAGIIVIILEICLTQTVDGRTYLYPIYPYDKKALAGLLIRKSVYSDSDRH